VGVDTIQIENVGREGHTFLYHITNCYHKLAKKTLFIKSNHENKSLNLEWVKFKHGCKSVNEFIGFSFNDESRTIYYPFFDILQDIDFSSLNLADDGYIKHFGKWDINRPNNSGSFIEWFTTYIDKNYENYKKFFKLSPHGIFTIERDMILNKNKDYYYNILNTVNYCNNPEEGHYLERSWVYIFQKYYNFSYGMTCMNRLEFLKQTLLFNLKEINKYPNGIITLLNYNCRQGTREYIINNFIDNPKLNYIEDTEAHYFHMSKTKNITAIKSPDNIDIVSWLDCDNYLNIYTTYHNNMVFNIIKKCIISPCTGLDNNWDTGSRISITKLNFHNLNGYNQTFIGWGTEDIDFKVRAFIKLNLNCIHQINKFINNKYFINHNENLRLKNYDCYTTDFINNFCINNNIPSNYSNILVKNLGIQNKYLTEQLNNYISINDIINYILKISNGDVQMYIKNNLFRSINVRSINIIQFNYHVTHIVINNKYYYIPLEFKRINNQFFRYVF
jgi:hypothetical protein